MKNTFSLIGIQVRRSDMVYFLAGFVLPPLLLFLLFYFLKYNGILENMNYLPLLLNGKRKLLYYFPVGFMEEFLFRGIIFGFIFHKTNNRIASILLSATIFAIPHAINTNAPTYILLLFSFVFGILACEMRCFTKSIWMSSAFHWTWNYSIVSVFIATNTNQFIYGWIIAEIIVLILLFSTLCKKIHNFQLSGNNTTEK